MIHRTTNAAFKEVYKKLNKIKTVIPPVLANAGTRHFISHFDGEKWDDYNWKVPQRRIPGTASYKYPKKSDLGRRTRKTLVKTGKLKREVNNSIKVKNSKRIEWVVAGLPYAKMHNYGLNGMPERKFMGSSRTLINLMKKKVIQIYDKEFK
jgi:phage gpG-like protein